MEIIIFKIGDINTIEKMIEDFIKILYLNKVLIKDNYKNEFMRILDMYLPDTIKQFDNQDIELVIEDGRKNRSIKKGNTTTKKSIKKGNTTTKKSIKKGTTKKSIKKGNTKKSIKKGKRKEV